MTELEVPLAAPLAAPMAAPLEPDANASADQSVEAYAIPLGSAYILDKTDGLTTAKNTASENAINTLVTEAIVYAVENGKDSSTIIVSEGTYNGGVNIDLSEGSALHESVINILTVKGSNANLTGLTLRILAESAFNFANNAVSANGDGKVEIEGGINITAGAAKDLSLTLAGLSLATQDSVIINGAKDISYYATAQDDSVNMTVTNLGTSLLVDTGAGDDTLNLKVSAATTESAPVSGEAYSNARGSGTVSAEISGVVDAINARDVHVTVKGGDGDDNIGVQVMNATAILDKTGGQKAFAVDKTNWTIILDAGAGTDDIALSGEMLTKSGPQQLAAVMARTAASGTSSATIDTGTGITHVNVALSVAAALGNGARVDVAGMTKTDRLHLSGTIAGQIFGGTGTAGEVEAAAMLPIRIEGNATSAYAAPQLTISFNENAILTDSLSGKRTAIFTGGDATESYVNYIVTDTGAGTTLNMASTVDTLFSNVVILPATGTDSVLLGNIDVGKLNLLVQASHIEAAGEIRAENLMLYARASDTNEIQKALEAIDGVPSSLSTGFSLSGVKSEVRITVRDTARLSIARLTDIAASITLDEHMFQLLGANPVAIEMATASISLGGGIQTGTLRARSVVKVSADAGASGVISSTPIAAAAVDVSNIVAVRPGAIIYARDLIDIKAETIATIKADANGGSTLPFALGVVFGQLETKVLIGDSASTQTVSLTTDGSLRARACSDLQATARAVGKSGADASAGAYMGVGVFLQDTLVSVRGNTNLRAGQDILLQSGSRAMVDITSLSAPASIGGTNTDTQNASVSDSTTLIKGLLSQTASQSGGLGGLSTLLEGDSAPTKVFDSAADSAKNGEENSASQASSQMAGALSVLYAKQTNKVVVDLASAANRLQASSGGTLRVQADVYTSLHARADGSTYGKPSEAQGAPKTAVGAAVDVTVAKLENGVDIRQGTLSAKTIAVKAETRRADAITLVKAGHLPDSSKFGLAGAVAVQIFTGDTHAALHTGARLETPGTTTTGVEIDALARSWVATIADASGKRETPKKAGNTSTSTPSGTGIGAGIAVGVTGIDVVAVIQDGVSMSGTDGLEAIAVRAAFTGHERVHAEAGGKGGTAAVPVVVVDVSGVAVEAYLGRGTDDTVSGDMVVASAMAMDRNLVADASATGGETVIGAAIGVSVLNDSSEATLARNMTVAGNVTVSATGESRLDSLMKASASGAKEPETKGDAGEAAGGDTDQENIENLMEDGKLGENESANTGAQDAVQAMQADGEVEQRTGAAAATGEKLAGLVGSKNINTNSVSKQLEKREKAQTSEGSVQVAAAIAVNVQDHLVRALIKDDTVLTATAGMVRVTALGDTDAILKATATATGTGSGSEEKGIGAAVAVNVVSYTVESRVGYGAAVSGFGGVEVVAQALEAAQAAEVERGLDEVVSYLTDADELNKVLWAAQEALSPGVSMESYIESLYPGQFKADDKAQIIADILSALLSKLLTGNLPDGTGAVHEDVVKAYLVQVLETTTGDLEPILLKALLDDLENTSLTTFKALKELQGSGPGNLYDVLLKRLATRLGSGDEPDGIGSKISTTAISGAGAANVGVAGAAAVSVVNGHINAFIGCATEEVEVDGKKEEQIKSRSATVNAENGTVRVLATGSQQVYTTATATADASGKADKNKTGTGKVNSANTGVGASAAVTVADLKTLALLGEGSRVTAQNLYMYAESRNDVDTVSVSGKDPLAVSTKASSQDIAVDASAAMTLIENKTFAEVMTGADVTLLGYGGVALPKHDPSGVADNRTAQLYVGAAQYGDTHTEASGFAVASETAVGAAVAVNIALSDIRAQFLGTGRLAGTAVIEAYIYNEDEAVATATAMGASLARTLDRLKAVLSLGGKSSGGDNQTQAMKTANERIAAIDSPTGSSTAAAGSASKLPLSTQALAQLNLEGPASPDTSEADDAIVENVETQEVKQDENGKDIVDEQGNTMPIDPPKTQPNVDRGSNDPDAPKDTSNNAGKSQPITVAAAVGVNVTGHKVTAVVGGDLKAGSITVQAENYANFRAMGSGAAVSSSQNSSSLAAAVAVGVNNNKAIAEAGGALESTGDLSVIAHMEQNMSQAYISRLAAQSVAGSAAGSGGKIGAAGAVSVVVNHSEIRATLKGGSSAANPAVYSIGGDTAIQAVQQSRLGVRAGALNISGGTVGAGASFALIYARDTVSASIENYVNLNMDAGDLSVLAARLPVTIDNYTFPLTGRTFVSTSTTAQSDPNAPVAVVQIIYDDTKKEDGVNFIVDSAITDLDILNGLASVNYYIESIAGSITGGADAKFTLAGSVAMLFNKTKTYATIGEGCVITAAAVAVEAVSQANTRLIGGALMGTTGTFGVGLNVASLDDQSVVHATVGDRAEIYATKGDISVKATNEGDTLAVTAAAALSGSGSTATIGGTVNYIGLKNDVQALVGASAILEAAGNVDIVATNRMDMSLIAVSLAASTGKVAAGGTVAVVITKNTTIANVGADASITAGARALVSATGDERVLTVLASASAVVGGNVSAAGAIGVLIGKSSTLASVSKGGSVVSNGGSAEIRADSTTHQVTVGAGAAVGGSTAAVGASVNVGVFKRSTGAFLDEGATLTAMGAKDNAVVQATASESSIIVNAAVGVASGTAGLAGAIPVVVGSTEVFADVGKGARVRAGDTIAVAAYLNADAYNITASLGAGSSVGAGAAVSTIVQKNQVRSMIGDGASLMALAGGNGYILPGRTEKRKGVLISARATGDLLIATASAGAASTAGVAGSVTTAVLKNSVKAVVGDDTMLLSGYDLEGGMIVKKNDGGEILVEAEDESDIDDYAGSVALAGTASVGATVVVMVFGKAVEASIGDGGFAYASGNATVHATSKDEIFMLGATFSGAGKASVAAGANVQVFKSETKVAAGGLIRADGNIDIQASSDADLINVAFAVGVGGMAAVTPAVVITYFENITTATVSKDAALEALGTLSLQALSKEDVHSDAVGGAFSGGGAISGAVALVISTIQTEVTVGEGASVYATDALTLRAEDDFAMRVIVGSLGVGGVSVSVVAGVAVLHNTVGVAVEKDVGITSGKDVTLEAMSLRDARGYIANAALGANAAIPVSVLVFVAGGQMTQDAADAFTDGEENGDAFSANETSQAAFSTANSQAAAYGKDKNGNPLDLDAFLRGDGITRGDTTIGTEVTPDPESGNQDPNDANTTFDGETGLRDDAFSSTLPDDDDDESTPPPENKNLTQPDANTDNENAYTPGGDYDPDAETNKDIENAAGLGSEKPGYMAAPPKDATTVRLSDGVIITAAGNISLIASEDILIDMISAGFAGSTGMAAGVSVVVGVIYTNVEVYVPAGATLSAGGEISLTAASISTPKSNGSKDAKTSTIGRVNGEKDGDGNAIAVTDGNDGDRSNLISENLAHEEEKDADGQWVIQEGINSAALLDSASLRLVSAVGAIGKLAASVPVAFLNLSAQVRTVLEGTVQGLGGNVTLCQTATAQYAEALTMTIAVGVGGIALNGSVAISMIDGTIENAIKENAHITGVKSVTLQTNIDVLPTSIATAFGGGLLALNGAVGASVNRVRSDTLIGDGVTIQGADSISLDTTANVSASAYTISVSLGAIAAQLSGAVAIVRPVILTYMGATPNTFSGIQDAELRAQMPAEYAKDATTGEIMGIAPIAGASATTKGNITTNSLSIHSDVSSKARAAVGTVVVAGFSANGTVVLAFNEADIWTGISRANVTVLGAIDIQAKAAIVASVKRDAFSVSGFDGSATLGYARLGARNIAAIDATGAAVSGKGITVSAGTPGDESKANLFTADVTAYSAVISLCSLTGSVAFVDNRALNAAILYGGSVTSTGDLTIQAASHMDANALLMTDGAAAVKFSGYASVALLRGYQYAGISGGNYTIPAGALKATSDMNAYKPAAGAIARVQAGDSALIALNATIAVAYGRVTSRAVVAPNSLSIGDGETITVRQNGSMTTLAEALNGSLPLKLASAGVLFSFAYGQGLFEATLDMAGDISTRNVEVDNTYRSIAQATVDPAKGGVNVSAVTLTMNIALADLTTVAKTQILGNGFRLDADSVSVTATGTEVRAYAIAKEPTFDASVAKIAANYARARLAAVQEALVLGVSLNLGGDLSITSDVQKAWTYAAVGGSGKGGAANLSLLSAKATIALAMSDMTNRAVAENISGTIGNDLTITTKNTVRTEALTHLPTASVSAVGLGLMVIKGQSAGVYEALLIMADGAQLNARNLTIQTEYDAITTAYVMAPNGGSATASLGTFTDNIAHAWMTTRVRSGIESGTALAPPAVLPTITLSGALKISSDGLVFVGSRSDQALLIACAYVGVNKVYAVLAHTQESFVRNVSIKAESAEILATLVNRPVPENPPADNNMVYATVGANQTSEDSDQGNLRFVLMAGDLSIADAKLNAVVLSYAENSMLDITGDLLVKVGVERAVAIATITSATGFEGFSIGILETDAAIHGRFAAFIDNTRGQSISAADTLITVTHQSAARAEIAPPAGRSIKVGIANTTLNRAWANSALDASAYMIAGDGSSTKGNLEIYAYGVSNVQAHGLTVVFSITLVEICANYAFATANLHQSAYLKTLGAFTAGGPVTINSELTSHVASITGSPAGSNGTASGLNFSILSGGINEAFAYSSSTNEAYVQGDGASLVEIAGDLLIGADTTSFATGETRTGFNVSILLAIGDLRAYAHTDDAIKAYVDNIRLNVSGGLAVTATGLTKAKGITESPGSLTTVGINYAVAESSVGIHGDATRPQYVYAGLTGNSLITVANGVTLSAWNEGSAEVEARSDNRIALLANVSNASTKTFGNYKTEIVVESDVVLISAKDVYIQMNGAIVANNALSESSVGFGANLNNLYADNSFNSYMDILLNGAITAGRNLHVRIAATTNARAETILTSHGLFTGDNLKAVNNLYRTATIQVGPHASLVSNGTLTLLIETGFGDSIYTKVDTGGHSATKVAHAYTHLIYSSVNHIIIHGGATISAGTSAVSIEVKGSAGSIDSIAIAKINGVIYGDPNTASINVVKLDNAVLINQNATNPQATISGGTVAIRAEVPKLVVTVYSESVQNFALSGGQADAEANFFPLVSSRVLIGNAYIDAYDTVWIMADVNPDNVRISQWYNVESKAFPWKTEGFASFTDHFNIAGGKSYIRPTVTLGRYVTVAAQTIYVEVDTISRDVVAPYFASVENLFWQLGYTDPWNQLGFPNITPTLTTYRESVENGGTLFIIGPSAMGARVEIDYDDATGDVVVRAAGTGLDNSASLYSLTDFNKYDGTGTLTLAAIPFFSGGGRLYLTTFTDGSVNYSNFTVRVSSVTEKIEIINYTRLDLVLGDISPYRANSTGAVYVRGIPRNPDNSFAPYTLEGVSHPSADGLYSTILVESHQASSVTASGHINNPDGVLIFQWVGQDGDGNVLAGNLYLADDATIAGAALGAGTWAHTLIIRDALNIGSVSSPATAALFGILNNDAILQVTAHGDVYLTIVPAGHSWMTSTLTTLPDALPGMVRIDSVAVDGDLVLTIGDAIYYCQNYVDDDGINIVYPGLPQYTEYTFLNGVWYLSNGTTLDSLGAVTIDKDELARYYEGVDPATGLSIYRLPNGSRLYISAAGKIVRVTDTINGEEVDTDFSSIQLNLGSSFNVQSVSFLDGNGNRVFTLDPSTGFLYIEAGRSITLPLSSITANWLLSELSNGRVLATGITVDGRLVEAEMKLYATEGEWRYYRPESNGEALRASYYIRVNGSDMEVFYYDATDQLLNTSHLVVLGTNGPLLIGGNTTSEINQAGDAVLGVTLDTGKLLQFTVKDTDESIYSIYIQLDINNTITSIYMYINEEAHPFTFQKGNDNLYTITVGLSALMGKTFTLDLAMVPDVQIGEYIDSATGKLRIAYQRADQSWAYEQVEGALYTYALTFVELTDGSLSLTPTDNGETHLTAHASGADGSTITLTNTGTGQRYLSIRDSEIPANSRNQGVNPERGYQLTGDTWVTKNGDILILMDTESAPGVRNAVRYNARTYTSDTLSLGSLLLSNWAFDVTIPVGTPVFMESLGGDVYRRTDGQYYLKDADSKFIRLSVFTDPQIKYESRLVNGVETITVEVQRTYLRDGNGRVIMEIRTVSGILSNYTRYDITEYAYAIDPSDPSIMLVADSLMQLRIERNNAPANILAIEGISGITTNLNLVSSGGDMTIRLNAGDSLVDARAGGEVAANLTSGGNLTLTTDFDDTFEADAFGSPGNPLAIDVAGDLGFATTDSVEQPDVRAWTLSRPAYLSADGKDITLADWVFVNHTTLNLSITDGALYIGRLEAEGATINLLLDGTDTFLGHKQQGDYLFMRRTELTIDSCLDTDIGTEALPLIIDMEAYEDRPLKINQVHSLYARGVELIGNIRFLRVLQPVIETGLDENGDTQSGYHVKSEGTHTQGDPEADYAYYAHYTPGKAKPFYVDIGESTGALSIQSQGDLTVTQQTGHITAGGLAAYTGTLTVINRDIVGHILAASGQPYHLSGTDIYLEAAGGIGDSSLLLTNLRDIDKTPVLVANLVGDQVVLDWIYLTNENGPGTLTAISVGNVRLYEVSGDMGIVEVSAGDLVQLGAEGSLIDARNATQTAPNVTGTTLDMRVSDGNIGTPDAAITTDAERIYAESMGDAYLDSVTKAPIQLNVDMKTGQLYVTVLDDLTITERYGRPLTIGAVQSPTGHTIEINAMKGILSGDLRGATAHVAAGSIILSAPQGNIGESTASLLVDTLSGTLTAEGINLYISEVSGDMSIGTISATGDASLTADGSILGGGPQAGVQTGGDLLLTAGGTIGTQAEALITTVGGIFSADTGSRTGGDITIQNLGDLVIGSVRGGTIALTADGGITGSGTHTGRHITGTTLDIQALDGGIGASDALLRTCVDILRGNGEDIYIDNCATLTVDSLTAGGNLILVVGGDLQGTNAGQIADLSADSLTLQVGGDIGSTGNALVIDANSLNASAANIALHSQGSALQTGVVTAPGIVFITADGSILRGPGNASIISGSRVYLIADDDIGAPDRYIQVKATDARGNFQIVTGRGRIIRAYDAGGMADLISNYGLVYIYIPSTSTTPDKPDGDYDPGTNPVRVPTINRRASRSINIPDARIPLAGPGGIYDLRELSDATSGVTVIGSIHPDAALYVTNLSLHERCPACDAIHSAIRHATLAGSYNILLTGEEELLQLYDGLLLIRLPILDIEDGRIVYVLNCRDGQVHIIPCRVQDGTIIFLTDSLGSFVVLTDWDGSGISSLPWSLIDNTLAGYMNYFISEDARMDGLDREELSALYQAVMREKAEQTLQLLDINSGTSLEIDVWEEDKAYSLYVERLTSEAERTIPVPENHTPLTSVQTTLVVAETPTIALDDPSVLTFRLTMPVTGNTHLWTQNSHGEWNSTPCTPDENGLIVLETDTLGTFAVTEAKEPLGI
ncbi:hypothetical protein LJC74_04855 [Eubacteriales bacterium OttesenSCG-928-A19]|nr:hypothetical protein [Eubacteriales bacterium OttesenSCG-928-A19]